MDVDGIGGVGALDLSIHLALPESRTVCYVEREAFAAAILAARMDEGSLSPAPVWDDITTFHGRSFHGLVDIVVAGFPCQPASNAGKRGGVNDERWIWPTVAKVLSDVAPSIVFLENVPGLLSVNGGMAIREVFGDLSRLGYDAEWGVFSAQEAGAPHIRKRLFILAHSTSLGRTSDKASGLQSAEKSSVGDSHMAHTRCPRLEIGRSLILHDEPQQSPAQRGGVDGLSPTGPLPVFPPGPADDWSGVPEHLWPSIESKFRRVVDGASNRVDRLRAVGNSVVPVVAAMAFRELSRRRL